MTRFWLALLRALHRMLPVSALARLGERLGGLLYRVAASRRHVVHTNLRLCFPDRDEAWRQQTARAHFRAFGRALVLEAVSWWGDRTQVATLVRIEGRAHFEAVRSGPVILLAPHFLGLNLAFVRLCLDYAPLVTMYARIKNPHLDQLMHHSRTRFGASRLHARQEGVRPVLASLKAGLPFYYLPDLDYGRREAIFVPFFGVPAATITGLARMARIAGAAVVPVTTRWDGRSYVVTFHPAWTDYPAGDVAADTRRMNAFIEQVVYTCPEQYFWVHKRFKTRPQGEPGIYG